MTFPYVLIEVDQQSICWMCVFLLQRIPLSQKGGFLRVLRDKAWLTQQLTGGKASHGSARKKTPQEGLRPEGKNVYFLTQAGFFSFSFLEQSTFLSSIFPPPCAPAKAGMDTNMKAETSAVITNFIQTP